MNWGYKSKGGRASAEQLGERRDEGSLVRYLTNGDHHTKCAAIRSATNDWKKPIHPGSGDRKKLGPRVRPCGRACGKDVDFAQ